MTQPLALILCQRLVLASQLVNRLEDLGYRVEILAEPERLTQRAAELTPMLVLADLAPGSAICLALENLKKNPATSHLPTIGFAVAPEIEAAARKAGATLLVTESALLAHLRQFLDQALQVD